MRRGFARAGAALVLIPLGAMLSEPVNADTAAPPAMSGMTVSALVVSPAYMRTGVVVAAGAITTGCTSACERLMVSRDHGDTWQRAAARNWRGGHPVITVDRDGHEVLFDATTSSVERSDDLGATWSDVGAAGNPTVSPSFADDHTVAVAGKADYVLRGSASSNVEGSQGQMSDGAWSLIPGYPSSSTRWPVFLGGVDAAGKSTVERCDTSFACASSMVLPVADAFAGQPTMLPSTAYAQDGAIFAHTAEGVFKSLDGGATFTPITPVIAGAAHIATAMTALSPTYREAGPDRRLWVAVIAMKGTGQQMRQVGDVYSSSDGGASWTPVGTPGPFSDGAFAVAAAPDGRVFAAPGPIQGGGLLCSPDGTTWRSSCATAAQHPGSGNVAGSAAPSAACGRAACAVAGATAPSMAAATGAPVTAVPPVTGTRTAAVGDGGAKGGRGIILPVALVAAAAAVGLAQAVLSRRRRRAGR